MCCVVECSVDLCSGVLRSGVLFNVAAILGRCKLWSVVVFSGGVEWNVE